MSKEINITYQKPCAVLICGSTLYAIDLAIKAASEGKKTVLAIERTNPFIESICSLRPYIDESAKTNLSLTLSNILSMSKYVENKNQKLYFNPHQAAIKIEDLLIEAGVTFYYNAMPVSALIKDDNVCGAVFGGKTGLFAIEAEQVIDCTLNSIIARTAGASVIDNSYQSKNHYSLELDGEHSPQNFKIKNDDIFGNLFIHHSFADFELTITNAEKGPLAYAKDFNKIYRTAISALQHNNLKKFRGADTYFHSGKGILVTEKGLIPGKKNLYAIGPMSIPNNTEGQTIMKDQLILHQQFPDFEKIFNIESKNTFKHNSYHTINGCLGENNIEYSEHYSFSDPNYNEPGTVKKAINLADNIYEIETDVLITGCGTSGVSAAFHSGKLGLSPLCVDNALEIGGANTVGGVTNLWFGNHTKAFKDFYSEVGASNDELNASAFFNSLENVNASVLLYTPVCGTSYSNRKVTSTYIITPEGLIKIKANRFIDATGDGSIAAWSGAEYSYGSERDAIPSWASFGNFVKGKPEAARQFLSFVDERSAVDTTRFIIAMRRCLKERLNEQLYVHPSFYIAPRTTRHIKAATTVTYIDVLSGRKFSDGILRAKSNIDTKGTETSNAYKSGFYPFKRIKKFEVTIPYSALIPNDYDNLFICGKAYSITNDALTMARMQKDLFSLGIVAAESLRLSIEKNLAFNKISVSGLQKVLIECGVLDEDDISNDNLGISESSEELFEKLLSCESYENMLEESSKLLLLGKENFLKLLAHKKYVMNPIVARVLCFWKIKEGIKYIRNEVDREINCKPLPMEIFSSDHTSHLLPDHGFAPIVTFHINNLAQAGDLHAIHYIKNIAEKFDSVCQNPAPLWAYTYGIAYAAERLACLDLIDPLLKIINHAIFDLKPILVNDDFRKCADIHYERLFYLRLCLARALARCGSKYGLTFLLDYLDEARSSFAVNAHHELTEITNMDFAFNRKTWEDWINKNANQLKPVPLTVYYH